VTTVKLAAKLSVVKTQAKSRTLKRRSLWIITSYQNNRMETLTSGARRRLPGGLQLREGGRSVPMALGR
jgi:hypothetical protein